MSDEELEALVGMDKGAGELEEMAGPTMMVATLGSLRAMVAEHLSLESLREDVRELVLDLDVGDGEIVMVTPEKAGIIIERMGEA